MRSNNQRDNDSSGDDEREGQIRVGKEYQINPPEFIPLESKYIINLVHTYIKVIFVFPNNHRNIILCVFAHFAGRRADQCPERALLVWSPCPTISNSKRK